MSRITMRDLQERIAIHDVEREARARWARALLRRRRLEHWVVRALPFAVLVMAAVFYALSAPHTAGILDIITPGWGRYAPIGWELGILTIAAFIEAGIKTRLTHFVLYTLLAMAVVINIAGAFIAVVEMASFGDAAVASNTLADLIARFGALPARYQVVLLLVVPIGAVIPVIAKLTGEIIIKLAMGRIRLERTSDEALWALEAHKVMHAALMQAALAQGATVKTASAWASSVADHMYAYKSASAVDAVAPLPPVSASPPRRGALAFHEMRSKRDENDNLGQSQSHLGQSQSHLGQMGQLGQLGQSQNLSQRALRSDVALWLKDNPHLLDLSDRDIARIYARSIWGVDSDSAYKTVQRARKDVERNV